MKNILIMNDLICGGGVEKVMKTMVNHLLKDSYKVTILTPNYDPSFYTYYDKKVQYWYINKNLLKGNNIPFRIYNKFVRIINNYKMKNLIEESKFDIAIAIKAGHCMKFVADLNVDRKLAWVQGELSGDHWSKYAFKEEGQELECMKKFNHVVCVSERVKSSVVELVGNPGNLVYKSNPIDENEIIKMSIEEVEYQKNEHMPLFMSVGRLSKEKGYDILLNVCEKLNKSNHKYQLDIIGDGDERKLLLGIIKEKQLHNVRLLGAKKNPYKYLKYADWFISTSRVEGYALIIQEVAILGLPIIATDCAGVKELLGFNNEYGIVTEINEDSIYNSMIQVIEKSNLQNHYKERISERSKTISISQRMKDIEKLF